MPLRDKFKPKSEMQRDWETKSGNSAFFTQKPCKKQAKFEQENAGGEGFEPSTPNLGGWCSIRSLGESLDTSTF